MKSTAQPIQSAPSESAIRKPQFSFEEDPASSLSLQNAGVAVIPRPARIKLHPDIFLLRPSTVISADAGAMEEAKLLAQSLAPATDWRLNVKERSANEKSASSASPAMSVIDFRLDSSLERLGPEGYRLTITPERVEAAAPRPAGLFYASQTFLQLLPPEIFRTSAKARVSWNTPCVEIEDAPRFPWRGQLLDCGRHFFPPDVVKRQIDLLALHKVNRLHWHLTEDQGWRIEIKKYPELTKTGAWRTEEDGSRYGGFYSQAEVREIVAYAAKRHIMIVPEIEMPGHSTAALASYPYLGCTGGPYKVVPTWGVFKDVYCAGDEKTFAFLQDVLTEIMELFPSPYIHIGGDECPKERWKECPKCQARIREEKLKNEHELQSYFIRRMDAFLTGRGRRLIGWDEILEGGLAPNAVVQSWRGVKGGIEAASHDHDVIMSPYSHCYLDYSYDQISFEKAYSFEPVPEGLAAEKHSRVLGLEGNMWTEGVPDRNQLDHQVFPRMTALAEAAWSPREARSWKDFSFRMKTHVRRYEILGVKYGKPGIALAEILEGSKTVGEWRPAQMSEQGVELEWNITPHIQKSGEYQAIFLYTKGQSAAEISWAALIEDGKEIHRDTHKGWSGGQKRDIQFKLRIPDYKPASHYVLRARLASQGGTDSTGEVRWKAAK